MQYKGEDLDLRVPHVRPAREAYASVEPDIGPSARWPRTPSYGGAGDPLWVDEVVLACCNYAYDIAHANAAGEVGLEHLVNALTRVEAAARVLEARGVREGQLRRESATLIASEIPIAAGADRPLPRRGTDFEDVLRRAVEQSSRRNAAASVDDVLWTLLHYPRELPAVALLRRLTVDWQRIDWGRGREAVVAPVELRPVPSTAASLDPVLGRISLIEDSLRVLHADLTAERKAIGDLIRDTQRDIVAQRGDGAALRSDISQRLEMLERAAQTRPEVSRLTVQLSDRIQTLEKSVQSGLAEGARNWAALAQRLQSIESAVGEGGGGDGGAAVARIVALEQAIEGRHTQSARAWTALGERLQAVERLVEAGAGEGGRHWTALSERLGTLETMLRTRPTSGPAVTELGERIGGLERAVRSGFGESLRTTTELAERLAGVEKAAAARPVDDSEALLLLDDRIQSIERMLQDQATKASGGANIDVSALAAPLGHRLGGIEAQIAARTEQITAMLRDTTARVALVEQNVASSSEQMRAREAEFAAMSEALVRLGENQHTLASAIADWRHESQSDFGILQGQLERLVAPVAAAVPVAAEAPIDMPNVARQTARGVDIEEPLVEGAAGEGAASAPSSIDFRPAQRQRGFWWWLFGTNDVGQSNRDAEIRWQAMHQRLKDARDRRRA